jgi:UDP-glucose 4-epimerase
VYGDGEQTRDYVYVEDVARASLLALSHPIPLRSPAITGSSRSGQHHFSRSLVYNIGTGVETSVNALAAMTLEAADSLCPVSYRPARAGEQQRSAIDPTLARQQLGWQPRVSLSDGLFATLEWFRQLQMPGVSRQLEHPQTVASSLGRR